MAPKHYLLVSSEPSRLGEYLNRLEKRDTEKNRLFLQKTIDNFRANPDYRPHIPWNLFKFLEDQNLLEKLE